MKKSAIKEKVHEYWNAQSCGTQYTDKQVYTKEYFEEIEQFRYDIEKEIFSFAQFTRFHGKKMLEVGIGAGSDFIQWIRAGCEVYGIDLTEEAIRNVKERLNIYGLKAKEIICTDCESIPFEDDFFDLVYSWGVIHHTPDTLKALKEAIRVCKPGGVCKIMVYNRHSMNAFYFWVKHALLKIRPWKTFSWCIYNYMESYGTKAYTKKEIIEILSSLPVSNIKVNTIYSYYDRLGKFPALFQIIAEILSRIFGRNNTGWFLTIEFNKKNN